MLLKCDIVKQFHSEENIYHISFRISKGSMNDIDLLRGPGHLILIG